MKPKVAYLFLVYKDVAHPRLWEQYFKGHEDTTRICCHAANIKKTSTPFLKNNLIPYWVSTAWGSLGLVIAQLELIRYALRDRSVQRLVFCSDSCVPIKTYENTYKSLFEQDKTWIKTSVSPILARMSKVTQIDTKHHRKNDQWVMLNRRHAEMLIRFNFISDFSKCVIPDEHYVGTVLTQLGQEDSFLQQNQTAIDWHRISQVQMTPNEHVVISSENIQKWRDSPSIMARKFKSTSDIYERWYDIVQ